MDISIIISAFIIGAIVGSFLNMLVFRLPKGLSLIKPGSFCPHCHTSLRWSENIPLLSYLMQKGRCTHCLTLIPFRYFLMEVVTGLVTVCAFFFSASILQWIYISIMFWIFIALIYIDFKHYLLPDSLIISGFITTLAYKLALTPAVLMNAITGAVITAASLYLLRKIAYAWYKKEAFGLGDVKLGALIGLILGWPFALISIFFGFCIAAFFSIGMMSLNKLNRKSAIPFGPFLIGGLLVFSLWGPQIVHWYFHILIKG